VLRRHEQQRIGRGDLRLEADDTLRQLPFKVLVIEGQIADRNELEGQSVLSKPREGLRELAIDGTAAIAADNDGDLDLCHERPTLVMI